MRANLAQEVRRYQPPGVLITEDMTKLLDTVARFVEQRRHAHRSMPSPIRRSASTGSKLR